jgi:hydrogenase-4 transcriptional activator
LRTIYTQIFEFFLSLIAMADPLRDLELRAWRIVGEHRGDLVPIVTELAAVLAAHQPLLSARLWRLAPDEAAPLGDWSAAGDDDARPARLRLRSEQHEALGKVLAADPVHEVDAGGVPHGIVHLTGPRGGLVASLGGDVGGEGVAAFTFAGSAARSAHAALVRAVIPPLTMAYAHARLAREVASLQEVAAAKAVPRRPRGAEVIVGATGGLRTALERVAEVARTDLPVVLLGETGTGKEVVARALHDASKRAAGPFHRVNCGAISPELIDSELFGHERGSFTGASAQRQGWFARADGGTLFLDEIAELPLPAQVRLLRVLQDGTFERVGGDRTLRVDVRVIAATHRNLVAMVANGRFRQDLWFRIAVFLIDLPPLRARAEDMLELATHFAGRAATRFGLPAVTPSAGDVELLVGYSWPGNIRELAAVIDRAVLLGAGTCLRIDRALGAPVVRPVTIAPAPLRELPPAEHGRSPLPETATLDSAMASHIRTALEASRGRVDGPFGAAGRLALSPAMLRARMRKLGIDWRTFRR